MPWLLGCQGARERPDIEGGRGGQLHPHQGTGRAGRREGRVGQGLLSEQKPRKLGGSHVHRWTFEKKDWEEEAETYFPVTRMPIMTPRPAATLPRPWATPGVCDTFKVLYKKTEMQIFVQIAELRSAF